MVDNRPNIADLFGLSHRAIAVAQCLRGFGRYGCLNTLARVVVLGLLGGCSAGVYQYVPPGAPASRPQVSDLPPVVLRFENPSLVPTPDAERVWKAVVDVVDDYFRIEREEPVRVFANTVSGGRLETFPEVGATLFEPWRKDAADGYERTEGTLQSIRRRAVVKVDAAPGGFLVEFQVFKELEDVARPEYATAGAATMRYESSLNRVVNPVGDQPAERGWIALGRDPALEQRMLEDLQWRVGTLIPPSRMPGGATGECMPSGCDPCNPR